MCSSSIPFVSFFLLFCHRVRTAEIAYSEGASKGEGMKENADTTSKATTAASSTYHCARIGSTELHHRDFVIRGR
jgi:hypothetical protein